MNYPRFTLLIILLVSWSTHTASANASEAPISRLNSGLIAQSPVAVRSTSILSSFGARDSSAAKAAAAVPYLSYEFVYDNNNSLYVISDDQLAVEAYSAKNGELNYELPVNGQTIRALAWSQAHGRLYIATGDSQIHFWDPGEPQQIESFATLGAPALSLASIGERMLAVDTTGAWESHHVFNADGVLLDSREWNHDSRVFAWNEHLNRLYYFRDGTSPNDIEYEDFDPNTGLILAQSDSPYHGDYVMQAPILVAPDGDRIMLGTGDQFDAQTLSWVGGIGTDFVTGTWDAQEEFIILRNVDGNTLLERRSDAAVVLEALTFDGQPQSIVLTEEGYSVVVALDSELVVYNYVPNDDSDGDGVPNLEDRFPLDPAASVDTDGDGYPDAWNPGKGPEDSTTGLELDAYPNDAACYLPEHGDGKTCDYGSTIPDYAPDQVVYDQNGVIYLLSAANNRVYRWDSVTGTHLDPFAVGSPQGATSVAPISIEVHEAHQRLYLGYQSGQVSYIELNNPTPEISFSFTSSSVAALIAAGNFLITSEGYYDSDLFIFDAAGVVTDQQSYSYASRHNAWNPVLNRFYHFRDGISPNDILYREIDPVAGTFLSGDDSPYHGSYSYNPPIRVSVDGSKVLTGSGNTYDAQSLEFLGSISSGFTDARWTLDGGTVTVHGEAGQSVVERRNSQARLDERVVFADDPIALIPSGDQYVIVTQANRPDFVYFTPSDDSDGDGVPNDEDDFPLDVAASQDSDGDGYPDRWNHRMGEDNSTTGLTLDAFPNDAACYLPEHGLDGSDTVCDITITMPGYLPQTTVMDEHGVVYLLSPENYRIYRWSQKLGVHLNPIAVGQQQALTTVAPNTMAYSEQHARLYLGYPDGNVTYVSLKPPHDEQEFATLPGDVRGVADVGKYVLLQAAGSGQTHYIYDADGNMKDSLSYSYYSRVYAWNEALERVYFFRDGYSPNDLLYETVDQATGLITEGTDSPYHSDFAILPPIRVADDGSKVLLGSGDEYDAQTLNVTGNVSGEFVDGRYTVGGGTVVLTSLDGQTRLVRRATSGQVLETAAFPGTPISLHEHAGAYTVVTSDFIPQFYVYTPNNDTDGDGVENAQDDFPDDPAASLDSDGDRYPDSWNVGMTEADSTTGLVLDAYPDDTSCFLMEHGDGINCDYVSTIPAYVPDQIVMDDNGIVYLLSQGNQRIYRWDANSGQHADAIAVDGQDVTAQQGPALMAYSPAHERIYLGYEDGNITYVDTANGNDENPFTRMFEAVEGLAAVGNYVLAQDYSGSWAAHFVYDINGNQTDSREYSDYSPTYTWNAANNRVYYFDGAYSSADLLYQEIDQVNGQIASSGSAPYNQSPVAKAPIRFSQDGSTGLVGSGNLFDATTLQKLGSLPGEFVDGHWTDDDGTVVIKGLEGAALIERRGSDGALLEVVDVGAPPLGLLVQAEQYVVVTQGDQPQFSFYTPNDDTDGDGVLNTEDAFPLDPAASVDTDGDGYPDAWNEGYGADDSTTGLELDAYPADSACYLPEHGDGVNCDYSSTLPEFEPDQIVADESGYVYMLSIENKRVYVWDSVQLGYVNPILIGDASLLSPRAPQIMAYSAAHNRLYFGYEDGQMTYVSLEEPATEHYFASLPLSVRGLASAGNFMLAQDASGAWNTHYIFDIDGNLTDSEEWNRYSVAYAWSEQLSRIYFFRNGTSPNDLHYETIDQTTGEIVEDGETPYHGSYSMIPPIRVSNDGLNVLLGSGDVYDALTMEWRYSFPDSIVDAQWVTDGSAALVSHTNDGNSLLRRRAPGGQLLESLSVDGIVTALLPAMDQFIVVTQDLRPAFSFYVPSDDSDGDGVSNIDDAFPTDPAASVDTDGDGYPDAWNTGYDADDSTTGLTLDAYPADSACYLPEHGDGVNCDYGATLPDFEPDQILTDEAGFIYMLSIENHRVYVWDAVNESYVNPIVIGDEDGLPARAPSRMAYSPAHNRLYFGYVDGEITYVALDNPSSENYFTALAFDVRGLASAGNFVLAQDNAGAWYSHHIFDIDGNLTDSEEWNRYSRVYDWNEQLNRIYFFRDATSPNDLHFETIDQVTGLIVEEGETPYHGDYAMIPPIRVSDDGTRVMLGSGDVFDASTMEWMYALPHRFEDGQWLPDGSAVLVRHTDDGNSLLQRRDPDGLLLESRVYAGTVSALLISQGKYIVVTQTARPEFSLYVPNDDSDGDGVSNLTDAFPFDVAASVDTDGDGYPDQWNDGYTEADSTTGLVLDAYPLDSACQLPAHGDGKECDIDANIPPYTADIVAAGDDGIVYLLSIGNSAVYRWDVDAQQYLNPLLVGRLPGSETRAATTMIFSSGHQRLYMAYEDGAVTYFDSASALTETPFSRGADIEGFMDLGNLLLIVDAVDYNSDHRIFNSAGTELAVESGNRGSLEYVWQPSLNRLYYLNDPQTAGSVIHKDIDPVTGVISPPVGGSYLGYNTLDAPLRLSPGEDKIAFGSGNFVSTQTLALLPETHAGFVDFHWLDDNQMVGVRENGFNTEVIQQDLGGNVIDSQFFEGAPVALVPISDGYLVITSTDRPDFEMVSVPLVQAR